VLALQLETALRDFQSAAVIFEATISGAADSDSIDNISRILANSLGALKYACTDVNELEKFERTASFDAEVDGMEVSNILRQEVEERKIQVNRLEESLKQHKEELEALRHESAQERLKHEEEASKQRTEMLTLRDQCRTNLEVLAKKERELEVLRDSLDVGDGTGYISDDASSDGEYDGATEAPMSPGGYGHVQAEALATLMANSSFDTNASTAEVEKLRKDLKKAALDKEKVAKELKTQRESLANAKMIISSLERANKSMMEDLRQRLQNSNTAIASLLDKSTQSEKQATSLKAELELLKRTKEDEAAAHKKELQEYKDQAIAQALQLAAKDREIQELRRNESTEQPAEESKQ
jgi:chromosome segregation ATPase